MISVLIAEDSPVVQEYLRAILLAAGDLQVVGVARNGEDAVAMTLALRPSVVLMDIVMPRLDGLEATRRIMETKPVPIVIVSASCHPDDLKQSFLALQAGAVAVTEKPPGPGHPRCQEVAQRLIETTRLMAEIRVVKRHARLPARPVVRPLPPVDSSASVTGPVQLIAIGASTGGPHALLLLLAALPGALPVPIVIVQHIAPGFVCGLGVWLSQETAQRVHVAQAGERALPGHIYLAPDGQHLGITRQGCFSLQPDTQMGGHCPSVACLFHSVAETCGARAAGVLLTGMGRDGASELGTLRAAGAITIAQDAASSVVHGMPGEAIRLGAAEHILAPPQIAALLSRLTQPIHRTDH